MIERFADWGTSVRVKADTPVYPNDAALARAWSPDGDPVIAIVSGGDLWRTLGEPEEPTGEATLLPIDLLSVSGLGVAAAHVVARRSLWRGEFALAMNAAWLGEWYAGPHAHPNDGLVDVTVGSLALAQRLKARSRLPSGTHLPHPALRTPRVDRWVHRFERPVGVWLDGVEAGRHDRLEIEVVRDAVSILV